MIIISAVFIPFVRYRVSTILINGFIGFAIAMFFVLFRAPDLALTQLVVETVTTTLFLLCFYFLPKWNKESVYRNKKSVHIVISILTGIILR